MNPKAQSLSFFEHMDELRKRILISLGAIALLTAAGFFYANDVLEYLTEPVRRFSSELYFFAPQEAFVTKMQIALLIGFFGALPVVLSQLWLFVSPALYGNERKAILPLVCVTTFLFLTGASFAFFVVMPVAIEFLIGMSSGTLRPMLSISEYVTFLSSMTLAFGIAFNIPVFVLALVAGGFLSAKNLNYLQKHAIVLIFIAAAVLTPGPDIASQLLLALPLLILFELSVVLAFLIDRRKR